MSMLAFLKPKTPVADWIDHAAIKALQDDTQATLKINEPLERLVALKRNLAMLEKLQDKNNVFKIATPLTVDGQNALQAYGRKIDRFDFSIAPTATLLLSAGTVAAFWAFLISPLLLVLGMAISLGCFFGGLNVAKKLKAETRQALDGLYVAADQLQALKINLQQSVHEIEQNVALDDVRQSSYLDAALTASPALKERFSQQALRESLRRPAAGRTIAIDAADIVHKPRRHG